MNSLVLLCTLLQLSFLGIAAHSQEEDSCDVLFQTQPSSDLNCDPYIGLRRLLLQCSALIFSNEDIVIRWYYSAQDSLEEPIVLSSLEPPKYIVSSFAARTELEDRNVTLITFFLLVTNLSNSDAGQYWCTVSTLENETKEYSPCSRTTLPTPEVCEGLSLCPLSSLHDPTPTCGYSPGKCPEKPSLKMPTTDTDLNNTENPTAANCTEPLPDSNSKLPLWSYFIFAAFSIALLTIIVAIAIYVTAKKTKSLRNGRDSPNISSPVLTVQATSPMSSAPGIHLSSLPVSIPFCSRKKNCIKDTDLQEQSTSPNSYVASNSSSTKSTDIPKGPLVPQHKRSQLQDLHNSASQASDSHIVRVVDCQPTTLWSAADAQKSPSPMKPPIPRKKRLPDILSNSVVATEVKEFVHSGENLPSPRKKPPLSPRKRISTHPSNNPGMVTESRQREGHSVPRRCTDRVASPRRRPPPIPQKKTRPIPAPRTDPDYVNTSNLASPLNSHFQPPTVVRDGQEYHILSQAPPRSKEGDDVHQAYTSVVNRYQISTVEEFPSELEASMHCYENEEIFPIRYQPLTKQTLEGSAEYCSTDFDYLNHPISKLTHSNHHHHWN